MIPYQRYPNRLLVHVEGNGSVTLSPHSVMTGIPSLVRGKYDKCVVSKPQFLQPANNPSGVVIHSADQRGVCSFAFTVAVMWLEITPPLWVSGALRETGELRVFVPLAVSLRLIAVRRMWSVKRHKEEEWLLLYAV